MKDVQSVVMWGDEFVYNSAWQTARLLWIAFLKNNDNDECLFNLLPKDVVKYILTLLPQNESGWQL